MVQLLQKTILQFSKSEFNRIIGSSILLLGIYPKELKAESQKNLYTHVHGSISHNSEKAEAT